MHRYATRHFTLHIINQRGTTLVMALALLTIVAVMGSTAVTFTSTDLLLGGAFKSSQIAFHHAEAGVNYAISQLQLASEKNSPLHSDIPLLDHAFADTATLNRMFTSQALQSEISPGLAFEIDLQNSAQITNRKYVIRVIGRPTKNSPIQRSVDVVAERRPALRYGVFASTRLDLPAIGNVYSYDSRLIDLPSPDVSTFEVNIGSNGEVTTQSSLLDLGLDGVVSLGQGKDGTQAKFTYREPAPDAPPPPAIIPQGPNHAIKLVAEDAIEEDPLDVNVLVETAEEQSRHANHNANIGAIQGNSLTSSAHLQAGNYYLDESNLKAGNLLLIDASKADVNIYAKAISLAGGSILFIRTGKANAGKVNIYLDGPASFGTSESFLTPKPIIFAEGSATEFRIFSRSDKPIDFMHLGDFKGLVYAPYAPITIANSTGRGYGLAWGQTVDLSHNNLPYTFFIDMAPSHTILSNKMDISSWKEVYN
jgi:hypothetical protein